MQLIIHNMFSFVTILTAQKIQIALSIFSAVRSRPSRKIPGAGSAECGSGCSGELCSIPDARCRDVIDQLSRRNIAFRVDESRSVCSNLPEPSSCKERAGEKCRACCVLRSGFSVLFGTVVWVLENCFVLWMRRFSEF